ncbi:MAG TPA: hypothetical protein VNF93_02385 [Buchnera sp. (in: enterobacteria)]|nr:hypothetical protein [Buchnera sp. (in: enterobacteria)]
MSAFIKVNTKIDTIVYINIDHIISIHKDGIYLTHGNVVEIIDMNKILIAIDQCDNRAIMD